MYDKSVTQCGLKVAAKVTHLLFEMGKTTVFGVNNVSWRHFLENKPGPYFSQ